jgi:hypothetical protein
VSGKILENLRNNLRRGGPEGEYQWDYLDGLTDLNDELQDKVKTAIIEGKIADEDFNGVGLYLTLDFTVLKYPMPGPCLQSVGQKGDPWTSSGPQTK